MNTAKSPYPTIYNRLLDCSVSMLMDHKSWSVDKAISKAAETHPLLRAYYSTFKLAERVEFERRVKAVRQTRVAEWEAER